MWFEIYVRATLCITSTVQGHAHHRPALCTMVHKADIFCMNVISYHQDGAQFDVVSLAVCVMHGMHAKGPVCCQYIGMFVVSLVQWWITFNFSSQSMFQREKSDLTV